MIERSSTPVPATAPAAAPVGGQTAFRLRLYVAGHLPNSVLAEANLRRLCEAWVPDRYDIEVIDFLDDPAAALRDGVIVTPTLVRLAPEPRMVIIGTLADGESVARALGMAEAS